MKNVTNDLAQMSQNKTTGGDGHNIVNCTNICVEKMVLAYHGFDHWGIRIFIAQCSLTLTRISLSCNTTLLIYHWN